MGASIAALPAQDRTEGHVYQKASLITTSSSGDALHGEQEHFCDLGSAPGCISAYLGCARHTMLLHTDQPPAFAPYLGHTSTCKRTQSEGSIRIGPIYLEDSPHALCLTARLQHVSLRSLPDPVLVPSSLA